jgi:hypothetical protein
MSSPLNAPEEFVVKFTARSICGRYAFVAGITVPGESSRAQVEVPLRRVGSRRRRVDRLGWRSRLPQVRTGDRVLEPHRCSATSAPLPGSARPTYSGQPACCRHAAEVPDVYCTCGATVDAVAGQAEPWPEMCQASGLFQSPEIGLLAWQHQRCPAPVVLLVIPYLVTTPSRCRWISAICSSLNGG